jgi:predicted dinucleotide-binding enzyme
VKIAIIGKGNVGQAIGGGWAAAGHQATYSVRTPSAPDEAETARAAAEAEAVAIATPWDAVADVIAAAGGPKGKTVIDCTNPLTTAGGRLELAIGHTTSGGERLAVLAPKAFVFKTLNQSGAENLGGAKQFATPPVMFVAGDDASRKAVVLGLVRDLGFEAIDAGPLVLSRLLEAFAMLWIDQALVRGAGRRFAFARIHAAP